MSFNNQIKVLDLANQVEQDNSNNSICCNIFSYFSFDYSSIEFILDLEGEKDDWLDDWNSGVNFFDNLEY